MTRMQPQICLCLLWVISGQSVILEPCPLYPQKRTNGGPLGMSALCQKQTFALQQFSIRSPRRRARGAWAKAPARRRAGKGWLSGPLYQGFNRLHHRSLRIAKAIISHLLRVLVQEFHFIDGRLTALAVIVAAQPDRDVSRISNLAVDELIACDL